MAGRLAYREPSPRGVMTKKTTKGITVRKIGGE